MEGTNLYKHANGANFKYFLIIFYSAGINNLVLRKTVVGVEFAIAKI